MISEVAVLVAVGLATLGAAYLAAPFALRVLGTAAVALGWWDLLCGRPSSSVLIVAGLIVWLAGHWAVAARDGLWRSVVALRFWRLVAGGQLDPTHGRPVVVLLRRRPFR